MNKSQAVCLVCDKELECYDKDGKRCSSFDDVVSDIHGAVICSATGNYGSLVFDPCIEDCRLIFNICDDCIVKKSNKVILEKKSVKTIYSTKTFAEYLSDLSNESKEKC